MQSIASIKPAVKIETLSLRQSMTVMGGNKNPLDATLVLSVAYLDERFVKRLKLAGMDVSKFNRDGMQQADRAGNDQAPTVSPAAVSHLLGLFDPQFRQRLIDPGPDQYRLAAITLSKNAQVAVIADLLTNTTYRLRVGEFLHDWRIESIEQDGVSLVRAEQTVMLKLPEE